MSQTNIFKFKCPEIIPDLLTDLLKAGAQELISQTVQAELEIYLARHKHRLTEDGKCAVVRNGYLPERKIQTGSGLVKVKIPKVRAKDGKPARFYPVVVPRYVRSTRSVEPALPWMYLKGVSTGDMIEALKHLVGPQANGLSPGTIAHLKQTWAGQYRQWRNHRLDEDKWVSIQADGVIYSGLLSGYAKRCTQVITGVNERGESHFLTIADGNRESTESWRKVLLDLKSRGLNTPHLAVGDASMGFWTALDEVYPETRHQYSHGPRTGRHMNGVPKS